MSLKRLAHLPAPLASDQPVPEGGHAFFLTDRHGRKIRVGWFPLPPSAAAGHPARASVIVCPGRTEFIEKYLEVVAECHARRLDALVIDWPGQGLSDRLTSDPLAGHVDDFSDMADALCDAVAGLEGAMSPRRVLLCHSMGGCIGLTALLEGKVEVDAAAFCAPMWGIRSKVLALRLIANTLSIAGLGKRMAQPPGPPETFDANVVTHDPKRWAVQSGLIAREPRLALGPVTWGFLRAAYNAFDRFQRRGSVERLALPVLVATAEKEALVDNAAHDQLSRRLPDVEHVTVMGARHEILMELDPLRDQFFAGFERLLARAGID